MELTMLEPGAHDLQFVCSTELQHAVVSGGDKGERVWSNNVLKTNMIRANCGIHTPKHDCNIMLGDVPELAIQLVVENILSFVFSDVH